jgi:hypothetical protein
MTDNFYESLVGPGKKFKDPEELAKGKATSDEYILTLEARFDQMREENEKLRTENMAKAKLEDLLDQWQTRKPQLPDTTEPKVEAKIAPSKEEFISLIDTRVQERETQKRQKENYDLVKTKLQQTYGEHYASSLSSQMEELGITEEFLNNAARNNPKALLKMLGIEDQPTVNRDYYTPPRSQVRPAIAKPAQEQRTWSWYQNLKETKPKEYYSAKTNVQMHKDALALGEAFEDGDFGKYNKDFRIKY